MISKGKTIADVSINKREKICKLLKVDIEKLLPIIYV